VLLPLFFIVFKVLLKFKGLFVSPIQSPVILTPGREITGDPEYDLAGLCRTGENDFDEAKNRIMILFCKNFLKIRKFLIFMQRSIVYTSSDLFQQITQKIKP
jgi:hypothetical protein